MTTSPPQETYDIYEQVAAVMVWCRMGSLLQWTSDFKVGLLDDVARVELVGRTGG